MKISFSSFLRFPNCPRLSLADCSGKLPASKGWIPGVEHQVTLTQYNPTNGQESVRSDGLTLILTASVVTPRAVTLDVGPSIPKPPAP